MKRKSTDKFTLANLDYLERQQKLVLDPEYQREAVWTESQEQLLIDSLLRDYDIPKLYFRIRNSQPLQYEVVDGQQRLRAVMNYLRGTFALSDEADPVDGHQIANLKFGELHLDIQMKLRDCQLDVVTLDNAYSDDDVRDIFLRLQNGTPLNAAEKRRAVPGKMRIVVEELAQHKFFEAKTAVCDFSAKRFAFEDAAAKLLHLLLVGKITDIRHASIRATYEAHRSITGKAPEVVALQSALNFLVRAFRGKPSPRLKKYAVISLGYLVADLLEHYTLAQHPSEFADAYLAFEQRRIVNNELPEHQRDPRLLEYSNAARADSTRDLEYRHEVLAREVLSAIPGLEPKDEVRFFTSDQRFALYYRDKGICGDCKMKCKESAFHADHIVPHTKGGTTCLTNGQVLCPKCNRKKSASVSES